MNFKTIAITDDQILKKVGEREREGEEGERGEGKQERKKRRDDKEKEAESPAGLRNFSLLAFHDTSPPAQRCSETLGF